MSEFVDDNASTTEPEENKTEEIDDIEDEEGMDGVSSEGEKTTGGNETIEVSLPFSLDFIPKKMNKTFQKSNRFALLPL